MLPFVYLVFFFGGGGRSIENSLEMFFRFFTLKELQCTSTSNGAGSGYRYDPHPYRNIIYILAGRRCRNVKALLLERQGPRTSDFSSKLPNYMTLYLLQE